MTTYAQLSDKLSKKLGEYEETVKTGTEPTDIETATRKIPEIEGALEALAESQKEEVKVKELTEQGVPKDEAKQIVMQQMQEEQMQMQQQQQEMQMQQMQQMQQEQQQQIPQGGQPQMQGMPMDQGMSPYQSGGYLPQYQSSDAPVASRQLPPVTVYANSPSQETENIISDLALPRLEKDVEEGEMSQSTYNLYKDTIDKISDLPPELTTDTTFTETLSKLEKDPDKYLEMVKEGVPPEGINLGNFANSMSTIRKIRKDLDLSKSDIKDLMEKGGVNWLTRNAISTVLKGGGYIPEPLSNYKKGGGLSRAKDYGSKKKPYPSVSAGNFAGGGRSYPIPTRADAVDALRLAGMHGRSDVKSKVYAKYPGLKKKQEGGKLPQYQEGESEIPWGDISQGVLGALGTAPIWRNLQLAGEPITEYEPFRNPYTAYLQQNIGRMGALARDAEEAIKTDRAYDMRPELVKAKQRYAASMRNAENASGSARFALQNMASSKLASETGDILTKGQNIEQQWNDPRARGQALVGLGGLYGNMGRMGYGIGRDVGTERAKAFDWRERAEAARRGYGTQAAMDLSEWAQIQQQMGNQQNMDELSVKQMENFMENFKWDKAAGTWVPRKTGKK